MTAMYEKVCSNFLWFIAGLDFNSSQKKFELDFYSSSIPRMNLHKVILLFVI